MKEIKVYKIYNVENGQFSTGGTHPRWTKNGKIWGSVRALKAHLRQFIVDNRYRNEWKNNIPGVWVVIELSSETGEARMIAREFYPTYNVYTEGQGKVTKAEPLAIKIINSSLYGTFEGKFKQHNEPMIPQDATCFEVFAIKDSVDSPTGKQAFIGFKISNGDFHFIGVPFTEPKK